MIPKLFRIVHGDGSAFIVQVPAFPIPMLPAWTRESVEQLGITVAHKSGLGEPWTGVLMTGRVDKQGRPLAVPMALDPHCFVMLEQIPEPPVGLSL